MAEQEFGKKRKGKIYSTAVINQLILDRNQGFEIDYEPFFMRDLELRAANIPFKMTEEEMEEYQKCYDDPIYYAQNYAKFMTDHGFATVELRDFQKEVISTVTEEEYDEENDLILPVNRNFVWMSARQSGKCQSYCMKINELDSSLPGSNPNEISIGDKYNEVNNQRSSYKSRMISKIKRLLYKLYERIR